MFICVTLTSAQGTSCAVCWPVLWWGPGISQHSTQPSPPLFSPLYPPRNLKHWWITNKDIRNPSQYLIGQVRKKSHFLLLASNVYLVLTTNISLFIFHSFNRFAWQRESYISHFSNFCSIKCKTNQASINWYTIFLYPPISQLSPRNKQTEKQVSAMKSFPPNPSLIHPLHLKMKSCILAVLYAVDLVLHYGLIQNVRFSQLNVNSYLTIDYKKRDKSMKSHGHCNDRLCLYAWV